MQRTIIKQFQHEQQFPSESITSASLFFELRHYMTESTNLIIARMKQPRYNNNWIFSKPPNLPYSASNTNWKQLLSTITKFTINPTTATTIPPLLQLTSELQSSELDVHNTLQ